MSDEESIQDAKNSLLLKMIKEVFDDPGFSFLAKLIYAAKIGRIRHTKDKKAHRQALKELKDQGHL